MHSLPRTLATLLLMSATWAPTSWWLAPPCARAAESDQFSNRPIMQATLADHTPEIDAWINRRLETFRKELTPWQDHRERLAVAKDLFLLPIVPDMLSYIEQWILAADSPIPSYRPGRMGIFAGVSPADARMVYVFGLDPTVKLAGQLVGTDKIGHFFSQGYQYYMRYLEMAPSVPEGERIDQLRDLGFDQESGYLGLSTDGVYSRADLASNWAGFQFWDALFDGERPYFRFSREKRAWVQTRLFSFRDFVTADWDEYLNPPMVRSREMRERLESNIHEICKSPEIRRVISQEVSRPAGPGSETHAPYLSRTKAAPGFAVRYHCGELGPS